MTPEQQLAQRVADLEQKFNTLNFRLIKAIEGKRHTPVRTTKTRDKIINDLKIRK